MWKKKKKQNTGLLVNIFKSKHQGWVRGGRSPALPRECSAGSLLWWEHEFALCGMQLGTHRLLVWHLIYLAGQQEASDELRTLQTERGRLVVGPGDLCSLILLNQLIALSWPLGCPRRGHVRAIRTCCPQNVCSDHDSQPGGWLWAMVTEALLSVI